MANYNPLNLLHLYNHHQVLLLNKDWPFKLLKGYLASAIIFMLYSLGLFDL